jgi:hypothetical protein
MQVALGLRQVARLHGDKKAFHHVGGTAEHEITLVKKSTVAMVLLAVWRRQQRDRWLPPELRGATCVFVETELTTTFEGKEFVGRLDRVYEMSDASFIPLEFKTRKNFKVYDTDIAELSLQAWLLRKTGRAARYEGFVVVQHNTTGNLYAGSSSGFSLLGFVIR